MRINEFPSVTTPSSSDFFVIDGTSGTKKISVDALKNHFASSMGVGGSTSSGVTCQYGSSGDWRYRIWSDGVKECWIPGIGILNVNVEFNYLAEVSFDFPVTFSEQPAGLMFACQGGTVDSGTKFIGLSQKSIGAFVEAKNAGTINVVASVYVIGK